ncbi:hypothetical protein A2715_06050 [Candidatus Woesebacteria bacterium RIFCSPHIGHO2_01_FULL_39_32]|uniref:Extracellular solute-binding protein, family 5 n=2 Tax=Candidatus Woeseibacteriota TaxID=1752722 RepID=A0A0G0PRJ5_9BACT|nr:MAG: Extracellular solute-binding protein, family 5 [Candidatus Woesebacteria bacterium GW2011_GWA1_39_8]OGM05377.1 MAG: hypothetical protein A2124_00220 [Candidatus Woesebacteria bacterium GWB1_37_5]OGM25579.1 MAG: hypothetical protein A2715_06050 [Candidatus Woesebacteria bacterium RIFCSPHIGHO2_01_FULL_39_32]OGM36858.1 MAG: hypothetical protein A3F01_00525 [Candidatus Woesebacteria bacterium RIFCSPHIGHO2_12_FULL_38_11]OGM65110.1 MAG: hypothetical protein A2893_05660 [Candidatus Woesebacter
MSIRYYVRLTGAYLTRLKGTIVVGILLGFVIFSIVSVLAPAFFKRSDERIGVQGRYHTNELPTEILDLIGDGLTKVGEDSMVEPDLATSWDTPDKGKTWIFHLKDDIAWQDEVAFTSNSINYEFENVTIEKPDEKTIIFKLEENLYSPFPSVLSKPVFRKGLLGTGEWKVDKITTISGSYVHELILVDKNKNRKLFKFYPTLERTKLAFKLGEIDKIENIIEPTPFLEWNTAQVIPKTNLNQVVVLFFNNTDPKLSDKTLRRALIYAIDKDSLGARALGPISPVSWAFNPQVKPYAYDTNHAKDLINELSDEQTKDLELKIVTSPVLLSSAEKIAKNWIELGIKTQVQITSVVPEEFQAYLTIFDMPKDPDQYPLWHTTQKNSNITNYTSPRIDSLLEEGRRQLDIEERRKIYLDFQRFLLEDAPAAFLYHPTYYTITRK